MKKLNRLLEIPFHPILFSLSPALSLFAANISELKIQEILLPLIAVGSVTFLLWTILDFLISDKKFTAIITSILALLLFSWTTLTTPLFSNEIFFQLMRFFRLFGNVNAAYWLVGGLAFIGLVYFLIKSKKHLVKFTIMFNIAALFLIIPSIYTITSIQIIRESRTTKEPAKLTSLNSPKENLPDIYYIIVDSYANQHTLKDYYNFDNSSFINFLKEKGFYVAEYSNANYSFTNASIPSSLNMEYLDDLIGQVGRHSTDLLPLYNYAEDNKLVLYLKSKGYKYYNFGPRNLFVQIKKHADFNFSYTSSSLITLPPFSELFFSQTLLEPLINKGMIDLNKLNVGKTGLTDNRKYYNEILSQISYVPAIIPKEGPKFVFVHSLLAHSPFVFDSKGNFRAEADILGDYNKSYPEQLVFVNKTLKSIVNNILQGSKNPPIIVLQSDHGPPPPCYRKERFNCYWPTAPKEQLKEKLGIINAYYFPDGDTSALYPTITPVNSFRVILNKYFGENLKLLPDRSFFPSTQKHIYDLFDVTDLVK